MAEQNVTNGAAGFKEAVCIDAGRVYDSCSEIHYAPLNQAKIAGKYLRETEKVGAGVLE